MTWRQCRHFVVEEQDLPGVRFRGPGDQIEERGLAGSVRADQAEDLARPYLEAYVVDGSQCAEPFRRALNCQHGPARGGGVCSACERLGPLRNSQARRREIAADYGNNARARLLQQDDKEDAEHDNFELRAVAREYGKDIL